MKFRLTPILLLAVSLFGTLTYFSCKHTEDSVILEEEISSPTEKFELSDGKGNCYSITLERVDNKVYYQKSKIDCENSTVKQKGVHIAVPGDKGKGRTDFKPGKKYWLISLSTDTKTLLNPESNDVTSRGDGTTYECFCEVPNDEGETECWKHAAGSGWLCYPRSCSECDLRICVDSCPVPTGSEGGTVIEADEVILQVQDNTVTYRSGDIQTFYGGQVKIEVQSDGNTVTVTRTFLGTGANHPLKVYNLTSREPSGGTFALNNGWYIPFNMSESPSSIGEAKCNSDPKHPCDGTCDLKNVGGCLECECVGSAGGDCDMSTTGGSLSINGGLILESQYVNVINI